MHQPSWKAWDELVWPPPSTAPHMLPKNKHVGYIQGHVVELGLAMPPSWFLVSYPSGEFICFTRGLIFEGSVLTYDPSTNGVDWIPMCSTTSNLLQQERPCSSCHYSDRCHHCHSASWAQWCEAENEEDGSFRELSVSGNGKGEGEGEAELLQAPPSSSLCEQESSSELPEVVG